MGLSSRVTLASYLYCSLKIQFAPLQCVTLSEVLKVCLSCLLRIVISVKMSDFVALAFVLNVMLECAGHTFMLLGELK